MIKVIVIDDHELIRLATTSLLASMVNVKISGEAGSAEEGIAMVEEKLPDVVIVDIDLPGMDGITATGVIKKFDKNIKVIVLSRHDKSPFPERALEAGADGYVNKSSSPSLIITAVNEVVKGGSYITPEVLNNMKKTVELAGS